MYWLGPAARRRAPEHLQLPGWAKHAWSCFFAPWIAEATVFVYNYARFDAAGTARARCARASVTTFCAPPTVWRMLIQADLSGGPRTLREVVGAGRAAQPRGDRSRCGAAWGLTIRDGYGQTETTAADRQLARAAGQAGLDGPAACPACRSCWSTRSPAQPADEGEICLDLSPGAADPDDRLPGRPGAQRRGDGRRLLPHRRRRASATPTATSPTSAAPTTCSRRRTTRSARSSSRAS